MSASVDCPSIDSWHALLELPAEQRETCDRHLETCPACQDRLDHAASDDALLELARRMGDPTVVPADPVLAGCLERLCDNALCDHLPAGAVDLSFLRPSSTPGLLGVLGGYEVQAVIGHGGMGVVLRAFDPGLGRAAAIKVLSPALAGSAVARQRFQREAQAAARVVHEHVVPVHGVHETEGLPYLVMQYVAGESLQDRLDRTGPLPVEDVVQIGLQTAQGLAAAHAQGLIHRDIKPANLLLEGEPAASATGGSTSAPSAIRVKITDFGLARMIDDTTLTQNGVVAGTPEYMSPEQARGETVDHRTDLFSLGSVLYACCTGQSPFRGEGTVGVLRKVSDHTPPAVRELNPQVPPWLEALLERLMAKRPGDRIQTATETATLLAAGLAHLRQPSLAAAPTVRPIRKGRRLRLAGWALAAGLLALLGRVGLAGLGFLQPAALPQSAVGADFYQDFRLGEPLSPRLQFAGPDATAVARPEKGGFRVTLPKSRKQRERAGLRLIERLHGDFEAIAGYEILQVEDPVTGHGVAFDLIVEADNSRQDVVELARAFRVQEGDVFTCARISTDDEGKRTFRHNFPPATEKTGRLRITRIGSTATLWAAEGAAGEWDEVARFEFVPDDIRLISVTAFPGYAPNFVDLRILDFRVRSLSPAAGAALEARADAPAHRPGRGWLAAAGVIGLLVFLCALVALLFARWLTRRSAALPAAEALSLSCPACERPLRVRSALAGKKVKCPACGAAVPVG